MSYRTVGVLKGVLENFANFAIMHLCRVPKSEPKSLIYPFSLHADVISLFATRKCQKTQRVDD